MKITACLTNNSDLWKTPKALYEKYIKKGWYDPCPSNAQFDGLNTEWKELNFVNPPYSKIKLWINKALQEREKGHYSVMLIPARTDTKWFRTLIENGVQIQFITGRLKFNDLKSAPFPSMFVVIGTNKKTTYETIKQFWLPQQI